MIRVLVVFCAVTIVAGPWYTDPGYDWLRHSVSELAGQSTTNAWIMRAGLAALGASAMIAFATLRERFNAFFLVFGLCITLSAVFPHRPFVPGIAYSETLDDLHSLFASLGGFAAVLAFAFSAGRPGPLGPRLSAGILALFYTVLPAAMFAFPEFQGLFQRIIFASFIAWMLVFGGGQRDRGGRT